MNVDKRLEEIENLWRNDNPLMVHEIPFLITQLRKEQEEKERLEKYYESKIATLESYYEQKLEIQNK